ncbi:MAG: AAA family ATPase [Bryobacteraceae bacterium]
MAEQELLRVTKIRVTKLFGRYDHEVVLRSKDRVTILHGPNGVGKTTLLRLTASALSGDLTDLARIPFQTFEVTLSDGAVLGFVKSEGVKDGQVDTSIDGYLNHQGRTHLSPLKVDPAKPAARKLWTLAEVAGLSEQHALARPPAMPGWMTAVRDRVGAHLIEAQRLLQLPQKSGELWYGEQTFMATVGTLAAGLKAEIESALAEYGKHSQWMDQTFPQRLLHDSGSPLTAVDLKRRMSALEDKRHRLKRLGLIDEDPNYPFDASALEDLDETRRSVMTLYVDDTAQKLWVLEDLARRIEILLDQINRKFRHKTIQVDREKGLTATTTEGKPLALDALSSGEQHELVLLYDLLFKVRPNTLVLIDEPELSLHVIWQKDFVPDLLEVVETTGFDVVLATHSPFIVEDRHDLMVALSAETVEPEKELQLAS